MINEKTHLVNQINQVIMINMLAISELRKRPSNSEVDNASRDCFCDWLFVSELNVDNWNDNCEAKSEAKRPRTLRGLQV